MMALAASALLSYLLGSVIGSLVVAQLTGGVDIRTLGSGNAGATNALRTVGKKMALVVLVIDLAKGWVATALIARLSASPWSVPVCGIAVMLGHVYPVFYGFRGGKGVATLIGAALGVAPVLLVPMVGTWFLAMLLFGYVGLASILGAAALAGWLAVRAPGTPLLAFGVTAAVLILYTHRTNLARMRAGTESRARKLWLLGALGGRG